METIKKTDEHKKPETNFYSTIAALGAFIAESAFRSVIPQLGDIDIENLFGREMNPAQIRKCRHKLLCKVITADKWKLLKAFELLMVQGHLEAFRFLLKSKK